jgi:hypothetical protein
VADEGGEVHYRVRECPEGYPDRDLRG